MPKKDPAAVVDFQDRVDEAVMAQTATLDPEEEDDLGPTGEVTTAGMSSAVAAIDMDDSALALDDPSSGAIQPFMFDENPDFSPDDVAMPQLRLLQGLSPEVQDGLGSPGNWIVPGYPAMKSVVFVPVGVLKRRELRNAERIITCSSQNAKIGVGDPGGSCESCPMAQWRPNPNGNGKNSPPPCSLIYSFLGVVDDNGEVVVLNLQKTATAAAKFINTMAFTRRKIGGFGSFGIRLDSVKQQGNNNSWFVPKPSLELIEPSRLKELVALARPSV